MGEPNPRPCLRYLCKQEDLSLQLLGGRLIYSIGLLMRKCIKRRPNTINYLTKLCVSTLQIRLVRSLQNNHK